MTKLEMELLENAAQQASEAMERVPVAQPLAIPPSEDEQRLHEVTHTPYKSWCDSCVLFKARQDRQLRDASSRFSGTPTISLDLA